MSFLHGRAPLAIDVAPLRGGDGRRATNPRAKWMLVEILAGNLLKLAKTGENTPQLRVTVIERFTENPLHQYFPHSATGSHFSPAS